MRISIVVVLVGLLLGSGVRAQTPSPSFSVLGHVESLRLDTPTDALSGGTIVVNGVSITLPKNLLVTMPGQYLTVGDLFRGPHPGGFGAPLAPVKATSGLALRDTPPPAVPIEAEIIGNIVNGRYIAGVLRVSQQGLNAGAGFIRSIELVKGELTVGPLGALPAGAQVARVRINDPLGVYGKRNRDKQAGANPFDERFAADPGNAPVHAETGFPMCIPRAANDPQCPESNRPADSNVRRFTCVQSGPAAISAPSAPAHVGCDPTKMVPLRVGDYVTYSGMLTRTATGGSTSYFVAAHAIGANLGVYTAPGVDPAYVYIEESIAGTLGEPFPGIDQEETSRFRIVGFTTDPTRRVEVCLVDDDASSSCGRLLTPLSPSRNAQIGRIRVTLPAKANFLPNTRDVRVRIENHTPVAIGKLTSGQYTAPVGEYIYPENTRFGLPGAPVPVPFENFCFLLKGGESLTALERDGSTKLGPLSPFPDSGHPAPQARSEGSPGCL